MAKKFFFEFFVGLDRVSQDKLFVVGMTLQRPRACLLDTIKFSKNSFSDIAISNHVTVDGRENFVQGCAQRSGLQCTMVNWRLSGRQRVLLWTFSAIFEFFMTKIFSFCLINPLRPRHK